MCSFWWACHLSSLFLSLCLLSLPSAGQRAEEQYMLAKWQDLYFVQQIPNGQNENCVQEMKNTMHVIKELQQIQ